MNNRATYSINWAVILLLLFVLSVGACHKTHAVVEHSHSTESCQLCFALNKIVPFLGAALFFILATIQRQEPVEVSEPGKVFIKLSRFSFPSVLDPPMLDPPMLDPPIAA